ncbi:MAG: hypothetical protein ACYC7J_20255 [Syntrophales bacterium]
MLEKIACLGRDWIASGRGIGGNSDHLREAVAWIARAQDATPDGGVSHSYGIGKGWAPSYPETTGYIIPTLLSWSHLAGDADARERALRMADWELEVRLPSGAIPSLSDDRPVVFDTGQVLFGWLAVYRETGESKYLYAARAGGNWLLSVVDPDGVWRRYGNPGSAGPNLYNARFTYALVELSKETGDSRYSEAASRYLDWALTQERIPGWFDHNCLNDNDRPLLHTIAYTAQGFLESGALLGETRYIDAAVRTADALVPRIGPDGRMPGRFDRDWRGAVPWSCLTGMAQMAIVWRRLGDLDGDRRYRDAAGEVIQFLKRTHDLGTKHPGVRGGVKGSWPVNGAYGRYRVLNWATKFFIDALLLEEYPGRCTVPW